MMNIFNSPVAKRTRLQFQNLAQGSGGFSRSKRTLREEERSNENGSEGSSRSKRRKLEEVEVVVLSDDETSEEERSNANDSEGTSESTIRKVKVKVEKLSVDESEEKISNENASEDSNMMSRRRDDEDKMVDDSEEETNNESGSDGTSRSNSRLMTSNKHGDQDSAYETEVERIDANGSEESSRSIRRKLEEVKTKELSIDENGSESSFRSTRRKLEEVKTKELFIDESEEERSKENGSESSFRSTRRKLEEVKTKELFIDESAEERSIERASEDSNILRGRRRRHVEKKRVNELVVGDLEAETSNESGSDGTSRSNSKLVTSSKHDEDSDYETEVERSDREGFGGSTSHQSWNQNRELGLSQCGSGQEVHEVIDVDDYWIKHGDSIEATLNGSEGSSRSSRRSLDEVKTVGESSVDKSEDEKNSESASEGSIILRRRRDDDEAMWIDKLFVDEAEEETNNEIGSFSRGSGGPSSSNSRLVNSEEHGESSVDGSEEEGSDEEESHHSLIESNADKEVNDIESAKIAMKNQSYGSASPFKTGTHTYFIYSSDDSESDDPAVIFDEEEEVDEDLPKSCNYYHENQNLSTEDELSSSSECESYSSDDIEFLLQNKRPIQLTSKQSPAKNTTEKLWSGSVDRKEKNHSVQKRTMENVDPKPISVSPIIGTREKPNVKNDKASDRYTTLNKAYFVKNQESLKPKRVPRKDDGSCVDSLLDPIIATGGIHSNGGDVCQLPLQFRFEDSEAESSSQKTDVSDMEGLFREMDFALTCEEIGSYTTPKVKNQEKDDEDTETNPFKLCQRGEHRDIYLEEQIGFRCGLCRAVILESRDVIPKLANYAPERSRRSYLPDEQFSTSENMHFEAPDWNPLDVYKKNKGTVWELIPTNILAHLYPHQQEGFEFLWENLAGTIELSRLDKYDARGGGGCIISHAPGTGKTLLTIVFLDSFLKKFPKCCPVIVAPASMLLTWEAEFKKWQVGFSFLNLNSVEFSSNEKVNDNFKRNKDLIRAMKIGHWSKGGSVLGVSYNLFEKLAGNAKNRNLEKMGDVLLDRPGLVVLDEGHTPRNERSNIWHALKKLKTKKRVILSGTPFQNNFRELFNILHLVRPATWTRIMNQKKFAEMSQRKNRKKSRSGSASEDIEKLKDIISPFVHVHKGKILESKLRGLKSSVIFLNPPPLQKRLIENLGNLAKTFEYEHNVALVSVHPSLILQCSLSEKEENSKYKEELEKVRLQPESGVKTRFVMELIRLSVSLDEKVLIFSQYIEPLKLLIDQIALVFGWTERREIMIIQGRIHQRQRQTIINDFNNPNSEVKVLLASTRCCSEGIHLIGASRVVLLDVVWNPSVERQAISRAYRLGQKKVVYTYHLMVSGTTEEEKYNTQVEKERLGELVFSLTAMAGEELKNNKKENAIKLDDKILQQMVEHQELKNMFKEIRYPEKQTTF